MIGWFRETFNQWKALLLGKVKIIMRDLKGVAEKNTHIQTIKLNIVQQDLTNGWKYNSGTIRKALCWSLQVLGFLMRERLRGGKGLNPLHSLVIKRISCLCIIRETLKTSTLE